MEMSNEEMLAYLRHSSLPQLVVEGSDDHRLLRLIERYVPGINVFPAGGKASVLFLAEHQSEFRIPVAFLIDSDFWLFDGTPQEVNKIPRLVFTDGYSIENDLGRDVAVEDLFVPSEMAGYEHDLDLMSEWFSSHVANRPRCGTPWRTPLREIIQGNPAHFTSLAKDHLVAFPPEAQIAAHIRAEYKRVLRGKSLVALQRRYLCRAGRHSQQNPTLLMELAWSCPDGFGRRLIEDIKSALVQ